MDIRDFSQPIDIPQGKILEGIFGLQEKLLAEYVKIEKLNPWPYNLNLPDSQVIIKDFIARVVEELGEAYESYLKLVVGARDNTLTEDFVLNNLYNFNEELADALHFLVETFIVSGFSINLMRNSLGAVGDSDLYSWVCQHQGTVIEVNTDSSLGYWVPMKKDGFILGGKDLSGETHIMVIRYMWLTSYHLMLSRNSLKNKPWKQTHMLTDGRVYFDNLLKALSVFINLTRLVGIDAVGLYTIYERKNRVNQFRIKSKY